MSTTVHNFVKRSAPQRPTSPSATPADGTLDSKATSSSSSTSRDSKQEAIREDSVIGRTVEDERAARVRRVLETTSVAIFPLDLDAERAQKEADDLRRQEAYTRLLRGPKDIVYGKDLEIFKKWRQRDDEDAEDTVERWKTGDMSSPLADPPRE